MTPNQLREKYLSFFEKKGHKRIPPGSLVPENDPTTLFTSAGMQQLVPYILGQKHPLGKRLVNSQPCVRTQDIEEVGDNRHTTFFEMLGNWSLGDYFKEEQIKWLYGFLTKEVGLDPERLFVSVFNGNQEVPEDEESIRIWESLFGSKKYLRDGESGFENEIKIYGYEDTKNWWSRSGVPQKMPVGEPGGSTSEIFYDFGPSLEIHERSLFAKQSCHINCDCGRFLEIGNSVFMQFKKNKAGGFDALPNKNIDFGGGFERILAVSQNQPDIFKTQLFWPIIERIKKTTQQEYRVNKMAMQVIADHIKAATFMISQGLEPSNKQQGYILRRLIRRAAVKVRQLKGNSVFPGDFEPLCQAVLEIYQRAYFKNISQQKKKVMGVLGTEVDRFKRTLMRGLKIINKTDAKEITEEIAFDLFSTYGFPFEVTQELVASKGVRLKKTLFDKEFKTHQQRSRTVSAGMFKGGLADSSSEIIRFHTATHLLHQALRQVLGDHVQQVGSNITKERLRFDFLHSEKLTEKEIAAVERIVNQVSGQGLPVQKNEKDLEVALKEGALAFFGQKYPSRVTVYSIGSFSKEVCGGPHVANTSQIRHIRITKQESVGAGKRRLYAFFK
ncbi:alanine--tRNA ligase [Patescibacteria group bacterium]